MRPIIVLAVIAWAGVANAEVPTGISEKLVRFGRTGCRYLSSTVDVSSHARDDHQRYASHFGKIIKRTGDGHDAVYRLQVTELPGWQVDYRQRSIKMQIPPTVAIALGDLERLLGAAQTPDVDNAVSATTHDARALRSTLQWEIYHPETQELCRFEVETEADERKGPQRRIFSLMFWN